MNTLSLFDGMSCGRLALDNAGVLVSNYAASEIDQYAIKVSHSNYPDIVQLGDVTTVTADSVPFDPELLLAGSPCQDFSTAGKQDGFLGKRGQLFWEFQRIMDETKPEYFLLENVKMSKKNADIISDALGLEPVLINSNKFVPQNRERLYWTNIPIAALPEERAFDFPEVLESDRLWFDVLPWAQKEWAGKRKLDSLRTVVSPEAFTLTTNITHPKNYYLNAQRDQMTKLMPIEAERLQGVPEGYTDYVSKCRRHHMLGNGWTIPVIAHILKGLNECPSSH